MIGTAERDLAHPRRHRSVRRAGWAVVALALVAAAALPHLAWAQRPAEDGADAKKKQRTITIQEPARPDPSLELELREIRGMVRLGKTQEALQRMEKTYERWPERTAVVQMYGHVLQLMGRREEALTLYETAIDQVDNPSQVLVDLERMHREAGDLERAFSVCLAYHERFGEQGRWVANEMESLIRSDELGEAAVEMIEEAMERNPDDTALQNLLVTALFFSGRAEDALTKAGELDRERDAGGNTLFRYAELASQKGDYPQAVRAYDQALGAGPSEDLAQEVLYRKAQALRKDRNLDASLIAYDDLVTRYPEGKHARRALLEKAQILAIELNRQEDALDAYQSVLDGLTESPRYAQLADEVRLAMADCHLELGRPGEAGGLYAALADSAAAPEVQVAALYQVGEMYFYQARMNEAETKYYELVDEHPTSDWVNDALDRILVIGSNADFSGVPLAALAQAEYQRRLGEVRRGLGIIEEALAEYPESEAVDDLLLRKTEFSLSLGDLAAAHAVADTLASRFPESELAPRGYLAVARHYAKMNGAETEARGLFLEVLLRFPESIEAPEARAELEDLDRNEEGRAEDDDPGKETG